MTTDYEAYLVVGFEYSPETLRSVFGRESQESYHLEDRWDPRTGLPVEPEKVYDSDTGWYMSLPGDEEYGPYDSNESLEEFMDALSDAINADYLVERDEYDSEDISFFVGPRAWSANGMKFGELERLGPELWRIQDALARLGLPRKDPYVSAVSTY